VEDEDDGEEEEGVDRLRQRGRKVLISVTGHVLWSFGEPRDSEQTQRGNTKGYALD